MVTLLYYLNLVPNWIWVIVLSYLLAGMVFIICRNRAVTIWLFFLSLISGAIIIGIRMWEQYLENHFIGTYDSYGIPAHISRSSWGLIADGWPLWIVPSIAALLIGALIGLSLLPERKQNNIENNIPNELDSKLNPTPNSRSDRYKRHLQLKNQENSLLMQQITLLEQSLAKSRANIEKLLSER